MELVLKQPFEVLVIFFLFLALSGSTIFAAVVFIAILSTIEYYRIPKVSENDVNDVLSSTNPTVIAHRGAGNDAPENTLAAFRQAKKNGASAVEFDLAFTSDGVPVIFHDDTMDRTTNGKGTLSKLSFEYVRTLNAAAKHPLKDKHPEEKIPTFEEAVNECLRLDLKMYIDVKAFGLDLTQAVNSIVAMYKKNPKLYSMGIVCSFNPWVIYKVRQKDLKIVTSLIVQPYAFKYILGIRKPRPADWLLSVAACCDVLLWWCHRIWLWYLCGNSCIMLVDNVISPYVVDYWHRRGLEVIVWTVNNWVDKQYFTNRLDLSVVSDTMVDFSEDDV